MAEAFAVISIVASISQLVNYSVKINKRLHGFIKEAKELPEVFGDIQIQLPLLIKILRLTKSHIDSGHYDGHTRGALEALISRCNAQVASLDELLIKALPQSEDSTLIKGRKAIRSLRYEERLANISERLSGNIEKLVFFQCTVGPDRILGAMQEMSRTDNKHQTDHTLRPENTEDVASQAESELFESRENDQAQLIRRTKHAIGQKKRCVKTFVSLERLKLMWGLTASIVLTWGSGRCAISPTLELQRMVKYTSPGFEVIWLCRTGDLSIPEGVARLKRLICAGQASLDDVNPDGLTLPESIMFGDCSYINPNTLELAEELIKWGARLDVERLLATPYSFGDTGSTHLSFLRKFLPSMDFVSADLSQDAAKYDLFKRSWRDISEFDPFFVGFLAECARHAFGLYGQTPLLDNVLYGSIEDISRCLRDPQPLLGSNSWGQTAFHLAAATRSEALAILLEEHTDLNVQDCKGRTPLDYAAAYGNTDSVILLLRAGASPLYKCNTTLPRISFWKHAIKKHQWEVLNCSFPLLSNSPSYSVGFLRNELHFHLIQYSSLDTVYEKSKGWRVMFGLGADPNIELQKRGTLLHTARTPEDFKAILEAGFQNVGTVDFRGDTALTHCAHNSDIDCQSFLNLLEKGADVAHRNMYGQSALDYLCLQLEKPSHAAHGPTLGITSRTLAKIAMMLKHGADPSSRDKCLCACSRGGCSASTHLSCPGAARSEANIWCLEWLIMISEQRDIVAVREALLDLVRVREFDRIGLTHTCCGRPYFDPFGRPGPMEEAEALEILDEESHLVSELENSMQELSESWSESIEHTWLNVLPRYYFRDDWKPGKDLQPSVISMLGNVQSETFKRTPLYSFTFHEWRDWCAWKGDEQGTRSYVDTDNDILYATKYSRPEQPLPYSKQYSTWVQHVFETKNEYSVQLCPDQAWYEKRMYWAKHQEEAIKTAQQNRVEIGDRCVKSKMLGRYEGDSEIFFQYI